MLVVLGALALVTSPLAAQDLRFSPPRLLLGHLADVADFVALDIDRDLLPDLVCAMGPDAGPEVRRGLRTLLQQADGSLEPGFVIGEELGRLSAILSTDFNRDGLADLVTARDTVDGGGAFLFLGVADDRCFSPPREIEGITGTVAGFRTRNLDLDEDPDLLVLGTALWGLEYLDENGFGLPEVLLAEQARDVCNEDFDGDGDPDLVVLSPGALYYFRREDVGLVPIGSLALDDGTVICAVDGDRDGDLDVVAGLGEGAQLVWNTGETLPFSRTTALLGLSGRPEALLACDLDGNGTQEILFADIVTGHFGYWAVDTESTPPIREPGTLHSMDFPQAIKRTDLSGDGLPDLLLISWRHGRLDIQVAQGPFGPFGDPVNLTAGARFLESEVHPADMDLDGDADLVAVTRSGDTRSSQQVFGNQGGGVRFRLVAEFNPVPPVIGLPTVADMDGDGLPDIVSHQATQFWGTTSWRRNLGGLRFSEEPDVVGVGHGASDMCVTDLDQDGDPDILQAAFGSGAHVVFRNEETGFAMCLEESSSPGIRRVDSGDFDGDGTPDILCQSWTTDPGFRWFGIGDSLCDTEAHPMGWNTGLLDWMSVVDLDLDGDPDILTATDAGGIRWLRNVAGDGTLFEEVDCGETSIGLRIHGCLDLDGDLDPDLLVWHGLGGWLLWMENLVGGSDWEYHLLRMDLPDVLFMDMADMDGDGDPDIIYGESRTHRTWWMENSATTGLAVRPQSPADSGSLSCWPNPFNGTCRITLDWTGSRVPRFRVFDLRGALLAEIPGRRLDAMSWVADFDADALASGVYLVSAGEGNTWHATRLLHSR